MKIEFSDACQHCDRRPSCEIAGQRFGRLEESAAKLGFTVTEGSVICEGKERGPASFESSPSCGAKFTAPELASAEERAKIEGLAELDVRLEQVIPSTRELIAEVASASDPLL